MNDDVSSEDPSRGDSSGDASPRDRPRNEGPFGKALAGTSPFVLEVVPPPLRLGVEGIEKRIRQLEKIFAEIPFDAVNVPEIREETAKSDQGERKNPFEPRVEPRELAHLIQERLGVPVIVNRVVVHHERDALAAWFRETRERFGVRSFVLVGGEKPPQFYPGPSVPEANELARETLDDVRVGNITIPGRIDGGEEWERVAAKMRSGADFFTSQIVYRAHELTNLVDALVAHGAPADGVPILLSVCPVRSAQSISFLRWLGVIVPDELALSLTSDPDQVLERSIDHVTEMWRQIRKHLDEQGPGAATGPSGGALTIGLNIAPVGPIPATATIELARRLRSVDESAPGQ